MDAENKDGKIKSVLGAIEKGNKVVDIVGTSLSIVKTVIELTNKNAGDGATELAAKADFWTNGMDQPALKAGLETRRERKEAFLNDMSRKTGSYVHERQGALPLAQSPQQLSQAILGGGIDPFLGSVVCAGMVAIDGYLTRRAVRQVETEVKELRSSIEQGFGELSSVFTWGTSELMWRLDEQKNLLQDVLKVLLDPVGTEAIAYRERAIEAYKYGWYDDALHFFLEAEKRLRVDFIIDHYIGNIYLFFGQHRDYEKAAEYFEKAARYSRPKSIRHTIYALMHKGLAHYLSGSRDDPEQFRAAAESIDRALEIASRDGASHFIPELKYQLAQYKVVAGNSDDAASILSELLVSNPSYILKVLAEDDFLLAREDVLHVIDGAGAILRESISEQLDRHGVFLTLARRDRSGRYDTVQLADYIDSLERISELYSLGDFVSLLDAKGRLELLSIPISHPRHYGFFLYSHTYGIYIRRAYSYFAPVYSRHPYREQLWAMGGELL